MSRFQSLCLLCPALVAPHGLAQTPSEIQKWVSAPGAVGPDAIDVDGSIAVIGSPGVLAIGQGIVYWGMEVGGVWREIDDFSASGGTNGMRFGRSNAIEGDLLIVGANLDDPNGVTNAGSAFIFIFDQQTQDWIQVQKISASDAIPNDQFGWALALDGQTVAVGAPGRGDPNRGGVYIFELIDGVWEETQFLLPANLPEEHVAFGGAIAIDGTRMVVGATGYGELTGRVFVYERDQSGQWQETAVLEGARWDGEQFGDSVDVRGDVIVVGAPEAFEEDEFGDFRIFRYDGTSWAVEPFDLTTPLDLLEGLGESVAIAETSDVVFVGANDAQSFDSMGDGNIRQFEFDGVEWVETALFRPSDQGLQIEQGFGWNMALEGNWLMVGAPGDDNDTGNDDSGAAYFYDLTGQSGTRSRLTDTTVQFGTFLSGNIGALKNSEDFRMRIRSQFGFTASEPNLAELRIGATNHVANPDLINLLIEGRLNQPGGTMRVRLRNWNTNSFNQVHQYTVGNVETVEQVMDIPAANYIRANDNRVEASLRSSALVTFTASGFEAQQDFINILVRE